MTKSDKKENRVARSNWAVRFHEGAPEVSAEMRSSEVTGAGNSQVTQQRGMGECCRAARCPVGFSAPGGASTRSDGRSGAETESKHGALWTPVCIDSVTHIKEMESMNLSQNKENPWEEVGLPVYVAVFPG